MQKWRTRFVFTPIMYHSRASGTLCRSTPYFTGHWIILYISYRNSFARFGNLASVRRLWRSGVLSSRRLLPASSSSTLLRAARPARSRARELLAPRHILWTLDAGQPQAMGKLLHSTSPWPTPKSVCPQPSTPAHTASVGHGRLARCFRSRTHLEGVHHPHRPVRQAGICWAPKSGSNYSCNLPPWIPKLSRLP